MDPYRETFRRVFPNGGISIVEMLFRTNLLALVGGGRNPRFPPNKVMIWDDHQNRCIGELSFRSEVKAVKLRRDRVVVVLATKIYVYRFSDLHLQDQMPTLPNPRGLVALCPDNNNTVLACPGINKVDGSSLACLPACPTCRSVLPAQDRSLPFSSLLTPPYPCTYIAATRRARSAWSSTTAASPRSSPRTNRSSPRSRSTSTARGAHPHPTSLHPSLYTRQP